MCVCLSTMCCMQTTQSIAKKELSSFFHQRIVNFTNVFLKSCRHERMKAKNSHKVSQVMFCLWQRHVMVLWKSKSGRYVHLAVLPQRDITTQCNVARDWIEMCSALQCVAHCPSRLGADEDIKNFADSITPNHIHALSAAYKACLGSFTFSPSMVKHFFWN